MQTGLEAEALFSPFDVKYALLTDKAPLAGSRRVAMIAALVRYQRVSDRLWMGALSFATERYGDVKVKPNGYGDACPNRRTPGGSSRLGSKIPSDLHLSRRQRRPREPAGTDSRGAPQDVVRKRSSGPIDAGAISVTRMIRSAVPW